MANVCVDGCIIRLTAALMWGWGASTPSLPKFGNFLDITINGSGSKLSANSKSVVLMSDITSNLASFSESYHAGPNFGNFANIPPLSVGQDGTIIGITLAGLTPSSDSSTSSQGIILDSAGGMFNATVTVPAIAPMPGPSPSGLPVPYLVPLTGSWQIQKHGQGSVKFTSA